MKAVEEKNVEQDMRLAYAERQKGFIYERLVKERSLMSEILGSVLDAEHAPFTATCSNWYPIKLLESA